MPLFVRFVQYSLYCLCYLQIWPLPSVSNLETTRPAFSWSSSSLGWLFEFCQCLEHPWTCSRLPFQLWTLLVWHMQNFILVMINCMLVMVRDLLYLILHIISFIHQNKSSPCPTYYMFLTLKKIIICSTILSWKLCLFLVSLFCFLCQGCNHQGSPSFWLE
jgi:hypothetical protein